VALARDEVLVHQRPEGLPDPGDHVEVLNRDGHAGQRRQVGGVARPGHRLLRFAGLIAGQLGGDGVERPDVGVEPLDAVQVVGGDLYGGQFAAADGGGQLQHGQVMNLGHASEP